MIDIEEMVEQQYDPRFLSFAVYVSENVPEEVCHDSKRIKQILLNLISNALKYTERGFVNVVVDCSFPQDKKVTKPILTKQVIYKDCILQFAVSDSGCGIEKKKKLHLFKMFSEAKYAVNDDMSKSTKLMGIGLAFCQRMLKEMKTELELTTVLRIGSTFSFKLNAGYNTKYESRDERQRLSSLPLRKQNSEIEKLDLLEIERRKSPELAIQKIDVKESRLKSVNVHCIKYNTSLERINVSRMSLEKENSQNKNASSAKFIDGLRNSKFMKTPAEMKSILEVSKDDQDSISEPSMDLYQLKKKLISTSGKGFADISPCLYDEGRKDTNPVPMFIGTGRKGWDSTRNDTSSLLKFSKKDHVVSSQSSKNGLL